MKSSKVRFFDTHCHLHEEVFDADREKIIKKMLDLGIDKFLTIGITVEDTENALRLRDKYPKNCLVSASIDPTTTQKYLGNIAKAERDFKKLAKLAETNQVSAIGETGLDHYWRGDKKGEQPFTPDTSEVQQLLFELHIDLAKRLQLPLVIHQREALTQTLNALKEKEFSSSSEEQKLGVFHSFTGDINDANRIIDLGFFLGINGVVTFENAAKLQGAVEKISPKHLLFETDSPFLTPHPYRGERNDPTHLPQIAEYIEGLKQEKISDSVYENSSALFLS